MGQYYFSVALDNDRELCISPLTDRKIAASGQELTDASGYFLYERSGSDEFANIEIIAQVLNEDGVMRLREAFGMS